MISRADLDGRQDATRCDDEANAKAEEDFEAVYFLWHGQVRGDGGEQARAEEDERGAHGVAVEGEVPA